MPVGSISVFFGEVLYSCFWLEASRPPSYCCTALLPYDCGGKISYEDATLYPPSAKLPLVQAWTTRTSTSVSPPRPSYRPRLGAASGRRWYRAAPALYLMCVACIEITCLARDPESSLGFDAFWWHSKLKNPWIVVDYVERKVAVGCGRTTTCPAPCACVYSYCCGHPDCCDFDIDRTNLLCIVHRSCFGPWGGDCESVLFKIAESARTGD